MGGLPGWSDRPPGESRTNAGSSRRIRSPELTRLSRNRRLRVLANFVRLESIPADWREWRVNAANASALAHTLSSERDLALLFRTLATLRTDIALFDDVDELQWLGPAAGFETLGRGSARPGAGAGGHCQGGLDPGAGFETLGRDSTRRSPGSGGLFAGRSSSASVQRCHESRSAVRVEERRGEK